METNEQLIQHLISNGYLKTKKLVDALRKYPRELFVPGNVKQLAYRDIPLFIGHGQTISQPSTVIVMTEFLDVKKGQKVLEIGAGSGWQAALISELVGNKGKVYTVDIIQELVQFASNNLKKVGIKNVEVIRADGSLGLKEHAPFDRIIVTAACPEIPKPLIEQLKTDGKMVIPVGSMYLQEMFVLMKKKEEIEKEIIGHFQFVPLVGKYGFK